MPNTGQVQLRAILQKLRKLFITVLLLRGAGSLPQRLTGSREEARSEPVKVVVRVLQPD